MEIEYVHPQLGLKQGYHPLKEAFREATRNFQRHPMKALQVVDEVDRIGWVTFADTAEGVPYYYNFRSGQMTVAFPDLSEIAASPLIVPRKVTLSQDAYLHVPHPHSSRLVLTLSCSWRKASRHLPRWRRLHAPHVLHSYGRSRYTYHPLSPPLRLWASTRC